MPRQLRPCGTVAAYRRHRNHGETPCEACRAAVAAYSRARYIPSTRQLAPHGTEAAYHRHYTYGQRPCLACVDAHAAYLRAYRRLGKAALS